MPEWAVLLQASLAAWIFFAVILSLLVGRAIRRVSRVEYKHVRLQSHSPSTDRQSQVVLEGHTREGHSAAASLDCPSEASQ